MNELEKISKKIGIRHSYLLSIITNRDKFYNSFYKTKSNGKNRIIDSPNSELKAIQGWILRNILEKIRISGKAIGFVKGKGIRINANHHINNKYILCLDIKDFFPTIKIDKITEVFRNYYGIEDDGIALYLSRLCTFKNYLPQGAVTSPILSNIVFKSADDEIDEFCGNIDITYTRYADDLTFSSDNLNKLKDLVCSIEGILNKNGYELNRSKTRILTGAGRKSVTGVILNSGKLTIGRNKKRKIRSMIYNYLVKKDKSINLNELLGYIAFLKDIEPLYYINNLLVYKRKLIENPKFN